MTPTARSLKFHFFAEGKPKGQPRTRSTKRRRRHYTPKTADDWRSCVSAAALQHRPAVAIPGAVDVTLRFVMPRPATKFPKGIVDRVPCDVKPDADNLAKAVLDELIQHGFFEDDARVSRLVVEKWYAAVDEPTGCHIAITPFASGGVCD